MLYRRVSCIFMFAFIVVMIFISDHPVSNLKFLTSWGIILTFLSFFMGSWGNDNTARSATRVETSKWYIIIFQISLVSEIIIVIVFWGALYRDQNYQTYMRVKCDESYLVCTYLNTSHFLPLLLLLVDFAISCTIFLKR